ncbi:MAG: hypothetical protein E7240_03005 [Lachnospiraceae bacterium]|nr:hypothetical protein [Lachnospiraceae bacterium]
MKKYVSLAITLLLAASVSACGTVKDTVSAAEEAQSMENATELPEKNSENETKAQSGTEKVTEKQEDSSAAEQTAEEENISDPDEETPVEEAPEEAPVGEVPEEALGEAAAVNEESHNVIMEDPESPIDPANLPPEGVEVPIAEEAVGEPAIGEDISNPPEVAGTYTLYAWDEHGTIMKPDEQNLNSSMTLKEDGTGTLQFNEETTVIKQWGTSGTLFAMFYDEHGAADGTIDDGVIIVDPVDSDDILYFYAKEGVDVTKVLSEDREKYILED